jgi:hypothetical protein
MSRSRGRHKGMVSVDGVTYRIERIAPKTYGVVRLNDDTQVGTFKTGREILVFAEGIDPLLLELVARDAVMTAKTSWVMHARPSPPPEKRGDAEKGEAPVSSRRGFVPA